MPEEDPQVTEWQTWRKKVDEALFGKPKSEGADDHEEPEVKPEPEAVQPPKKEAKPPEKPTEEQPAPKKDKGPLATLFFGK